MAKTLCPLSRNTYRTSGLKLYKKLFKEIDPGGKQALRSHRGTRQTNAERTQTESDDKPNPGSTYVRRHFVCVEFETGAQPGSDQTGDPI